MDIDKFNKEFNLEQFNKAFETLILREDDPILKLFIKFISDEILLSKTISENDKKITPPALSFTNAFENEISEIFEKSSSTFNETRKISTLFSYLFCTLNGKFYSKGETFGFANKYLFNPIFFEYKKEVEVCPQMEVAIENVIFETRSIIYRASYKEMIDYLSKISTDFDKVSVYDSLLKYLSNSLFTDDEIGPDKKVIKYKKDFTTNELIHNDAILFLIDKNNESFKKWFDVNYHKSKLKEFIREYRLKADKISDFLVDDDKVKDEALKIKAEFKHKKFIFCTYFRATKEEKVDVEEMESLSGIVSIIDDYLDILNIIDKAEEVKDKEKNVTLTVLVYLNRYGIANLVLMDELNQKSCWDNNGYDAVHDNKLVNEAFNKSKDVENHINSLAKVFNCINLNQFFKEGNTLIYGLPYDSDCTRVISKKENSFKKNVIASEFYEDLSKKIYKKAHIYKAVFSRLTYNHKSVLLDDVSSNLFYDAFTYFVSYSHSFDKMTLFDIVKEKEDTKEFAKQLSPILLLKTSQVHFDDSQFTYSIMDQYSRYIDFNNLIKDEKADKDNIQSHKYRIYSLWEFASLCGAIIFGTSSNLLNEELIKYTNYNFAMNKKGIVSVFGQYRLSKIYSDINIKCNHQIFSTKMRNLPLLNAVFEKIGLVEVELKLKHIFDAAWQHANIKTNRLYTKLNLIFTISSFAIGLIGFAWAGAIFIDFNMTEKGVYTFWLLLKDLIKTQKFHFVLLFALIPFIVYLILQIIEIVKILRAYDNLSKFFIGNEYHNFRKGQKRQKKRIKKEKSRKKTENTGKK